MKLRNLIAGFLILFFISPIFGQQRAPSPLSTTEQRIGLTDISVVYSRPGVKGRTIFAADGLAPFDQIWRTGANSATKITFSDDVKLEGSDLAAGSYAILTVPGAESWKVNFYTYDGSRWASYRDAEPVVSVMASVQKVDSKIENFVIHFDQLRDYSGVMVFGWDDTIVPVNIAVK